MRNGNHFGKDELASAFGRIRELEVTGRAGGDRGGRMEHVLPHTEGRDGIFSEWSKGESDG